MSKNKIYFSKMAELLIFHNIISKPKDLKEDNFKELIMDFQDKAGILVDGDPGPETLWHLQEAWVVHNPRMQFVRCEADMVQGHEGFSFVKLREDAAQRYQAIRSEVVSLGGVITTAGGVRELTSGANQHRSAKSMHYTGLAFDLALTTGFFKPDKDPFVITRGTNTYWNVWCRAEGGNEQELTAIHWKSWNSGKDLKKKVKGKFIDFTKLCKKHGFHPIGPRSAFRRQNNRKYLSSEWWHFQANDLLVPNLSQFGIELKRIQGYSPIFINSKNEGVWGNRKSIYTRNWL